MLAKKANGEYVDCNIQLQGYKLQLAWANGEIEEVVLDAGYTSISRISDEIFVTAPFIETLSLRVRLSLVYGDLLTVCSHRPTTSKKEFCGTRA